MNAENAEKNIWDQIRSLIQVQWRVIQTGLTILSGLLMAIVFLRKEMAGPVGFDPARPYPFGHWIIGFGLLLIAATIFYNMSSWVRKRLYYYIEALKDLPAAYPKDNVIIYPPLPKEISIANYTRVIFWIFPLLDLIIYIAKWTIYITSKCT